MVLTIDIGGTQYRLAAIDRNGGVRTDPAGQDRRCRRCIVDD